MKMEQGQSEWASNVLIIVSFTMCGIFAIVFSILWYFGLWWRADEFSWHVGAIADVVGVIYLTLAVVWFRMHRNQMRDS